MTFIDQTIVAIASPKVQDELALSRNGTQWVINGYILALAAGFALRGRLADVLGSRPIALIGGLTAISMVAFVPVFFFASVYSQVSLGFDANNAGLYLPVFFGGFAPAAQIGGRILDQRGAKPALVVGSALAAVGFGLWAWKLTDLELGAQWWCIVLAGAGIGLILGPRAPTQPTAPSTRRTARSPESPRHCATTGRLWAWPCSEPCWATSSPAG